MTPVLRPAHSAHVLLIGLELAPCPADLGGSSRLKPRDQLL